MTTYVFPGQGSQTKGMGAELFAAFPDYLEKANRILGYSMQTLCLEDPKGELGQTQFTQPALYVVNALSYLKQSQENPTPPQFVAGHSLGEYNALFAAGVFDFETGLKLVQKRGALMSQASGGGMAAVIGLTIDAVEKLLQDSRFSSLAIANVNSHLQIIVTGQKEAILNAESLFTEAGARMYIPLNVSGAFHSRYMDDAQHEFSEFIKGFSFGAPKIPVIANLTALPYEPDQILSTLSLQINHPVLWRQTIEYLIAKGETVFQELGPGKVLAGLIGKIQKGQ